MKTTLELPDPLFRALKARAAIRGIKLKTLLEEIVSAALAAPEPSTSRRRASPLPAFPYLKGKAIGIHTNAELEQLLADEDAANARN